MGTLGNHSFLDFNLCEEAIVVQSESVETEVIDITIKKEASCGFVIKGGKICYTITIDNKSDVELEDVTFRDPLDQNLTYEEDSFEVDGHKVQPEIEDNVITHKLNIPAETIIEIKFCAIAFKPEEEGDDDNDRDEGNDA